MSTSRGRRRRRPCATPRRSAHRCRERARWSKNRLLRRQRAGFLKRRGQFARLDLARLDVGLIERIDAEDRAGNRGRDLEAEEFLADDGRSTSCRCGPPDGRPLRARRAARPARHRPRRRAQIDEQAIVAIGRGVAERLVVDRNDALAVLAGRFGDQLLEPRRRNRRCFVEDDDRQLVAAFGPARPMASAERTPGFSAAARPRRRSAPSRRRARSALRTSIPVAAAGTRPNGDSTE